MSGAPSPVIEARNIHRWYGEAEARVEILKGVDITVRAGEYVAIMGASGSGKSTLLSILGCLDRPGTGSYMLNGHDVLVLNDNRLSEMRLRTIGFVFQSFQLIPQLSILENVELPLFYASVGRRERRARAQALLERVGLGHRLTHRPTQLSGGEQQRTAIARALVLDPPLLLADEPTGNLDSASGESILQLLDELNAEGRTMVMVTHDDDVAAAASRVVRVKDGLVVERDEYEGRAA